MKGLKKKRRIQLVIVTFVALIMSTALIGYGLRDGINYYKSPSQVTELTPDPAEVFRLGGLVVEGSITRGQDAAVSFGITDGFETVMARYTGILPDLFEEGQSTIVTGKFIDGVFQATVVLAKHDESYMPREVADMLKEKGVYEELGGS